MANSISIKAQNLAVEAGMQWDARYSHWVSPRGKFEGEQWYAPYYWDCLMNGDGETVDSGRDEGDETDATADLFHVDAEESEAFGIECGRWILIRCDCQGFVMVTDHATRDEAETKARHWFGA